MKSLVSLPINAAQKNEVFRDDFFSKSEQICSVLICSHFLKKLLTENFIFGAVKKCSLSQCIGFFGSILALLTLR